MFDNDAKPPRAYAAEALEIAVSGGDVADFIDNIADDAVRELTKANLKINLNRVRFHARRVASFSRAIDRERYLTQRLPGKSDSIIRLILKYIKTYSGSE